MTKQSPTPNRKAARHQIHQGFTPANAPAWQYRKSSPLLLSAFTKLCIGYVMLGGLTLAGVMITDTTAAEWVNSLHAAKTYLMEQSSAQTVDALRLWRQLEQRFPLACDWMLQDGLDEPLWAHIPAGGQGGSQRQTAVIGDKMATLLTTINFDRWVQMTRRVLAELGDEGTTLQQQLTDAAAGKDETKLAALYLNACQARRAKRLTPLVEKKPQGIVFARHYNMGGSHYAYTEGLSDAQSERLFLPGSQLCLLRMEGLYGRVEILLNAPDGVIRDVDTSWDGKHILFSWKKSDRKDDYGLYLMEVDTHKVTTITNDLGHADYEGVFLPNGDILFNSTRCVQIVDCWWTEVSNLYTCGPDGRFLRRLGFDQVHTNYPTVTEDGRILYTRWEYNDRGQIFPQSLFQMFPDGTAQTAFYGNNSWFPTTIIHARHIPGTQKVMAVFTGHHSLQAGKLGILDPGRGRQENQGAQLVAPVRETPAERIDAYGQDGDLFMYPWPLDERHFLVSYAPRGWEDNELGRYRTVFGLYLMDIDGRRELLDIDTDKGISTGRMAILAERPRPHVRPSTVDYQKTTGIYYIQDIYEGPGLKDVARGTIRNLRVVALEYRPAGIGSNTNHGPAGGALSSTPISVFGCWDVKTVLGQAPVFEDGSAMFEVPARTPVYFQALDAKGYAVQTMRSWSTLQPGEISSCIGCHSENKQAAPLLHKASQAMRAGVQPLQPTDGPVEGFSFIKRVQPILDRRCISCHNDRTDSRFANNPLIRPTPESKSDSKQAGRRRAFSLLSTPNHDPDAQRYWSDAYLALTEPSLGAFRAPSEGLVRWVHPQSEPSIQPPYSTGAAISPLIKMLEKRHHGVSLPASELQTIALWIDLGVPYCGDYMEANAWSQEDKNKYQHFLEKRRAMEQIERNNIQALIESRNGK
ncbi:hypothetical protein ACQ9LF_01885 [Anaerohalosphaeraceae bacterium U12dextr]